MVALTFPDGARREYPQRHHRSRHREGHLALARQAHRRDGARRHGRRPRRSDREGRQARIPDARGPARAGADPPRRRPCDGGGGAVAVARHAGHHRPGDRQRLLLRLLPQRAVHAGRPAGDREEDARDHRARQTLHQGGVAARRSQARVQGEGRELQGRAGRRHPARPGLENLSPGRLVRSLPRPAHDLDRQDRQAPSNCRRWPAPIGAATATTRC